MTTEGLQSENDRVGAGDESAVAAGESVRDAPRLEAPSSDLRERIEGAGWRQGSIIPDTTEIRSALRIVPFAQFETLPTTCWLLLASQDCDIACDSLDVESAAEVLVAEPIDAMRAAYRQVRHPRELHITLRRHDGLEQPVRVRARNRALFARELLVGATPDATWTLPDEYVEQIGGFLAARYARIAFPTAFETRIRRAKSQLERVLETYADQVLDVFFSLQPAQAELPDKEEYQLTVYAVVRDEIVFGDPKAYTQLRADLAAALRKPIRKCDGVKLEKVNVCGRDDITMAELNGMMAINFGA